MQEILNKQEYRAAAMDQFGKHVPAVTDTRMNGVVCSSFAEKLERRKLGQQSQFCTGVCKKKRQLKGAAVQRELEPRSRGLAIVRSRYQATISEDTAGWKILSLILQNVEIAVVLHGIVICSYNM
jgi:hypothetical protein